MFYVTIKDGHEIVVRTRRGRRRIVYRGKRGQLGIPKELKGEVFVARTSRVSPITLAGAAHSSSESK